MAEQRRKSAWGDTLREQVLRTAIAKRAIGVPTYSVPEAAALLSVSADHLYRLIRAGGFPAVRMRVAGGQGRYVVPAKAVDQLVGEAVAECGSVEVSEWSAGWSAATAGGVA
jgi:excisionase family DNA binding protein